MANLQSTLTIKLVDDVSSPAQAMAKAMAEAEARVKALASAGVTGRLQQSLSAFGASATEIEKVSAAWKSYAASENLAANAASWTKTQAAQVRAWESSVVSSLRSVRREQQATLRAQEVAAAQQARQPTGLFGMSGPAGMIGLLAAYKAQHFAREVATTYREFDKERRFAGAVMGLTAAQMEPLVQQAMKLGGSTQYNAMQILASQRELAARGLKQEQILGVIPAAAEFGGAMDLPLPEAVRQIEGSLFGFARDISTTAKTAAAVARTTDMQVKAAKISGMKPEDLQALYKFGATPARLAGLDESLLLAFGGVLKKSNIGGDEAGVAFRQMMARTVAPTRDAKEALLAAGLNFKDYQKTPDAGMDTQKFVEMIAAKYGVGLRGRARAGLDKIFHDDELLADPAKFTPATMAMLKHTLGGKDARSLRSIASAANHFRDTSMQGVDVNRLVGDLFRVMSTRGDSAALQLANTFFGPKQGGRIVAALKNDPIFRAFVDQIIQSEGYRAGVNRERMDGFSGATKRLEGSLDTLKAAIGLAFDKRGEGGPLTWATGTMASFVAAVAAAPPPLLRMASAAAAAAALWAGAKGIGLFAGGFGLKSSAVALDGSAAALTRAAMVLGAGGATPNSLLNKVEKNAPTIGLLGGLAAGAAGLLAGLPVLMWHAEGAAMRDELIAQAKKDAEQGKGPLANAPKTWGELIRRTPRTESNLNADDPFATPKPTIDSSSIDAALKKLDELKRSLLDIGGISVAPEVKPHIGGIGHAANESARPVRTGSAADWLRGGYSDYGFDVG